MSGIDGNDRGALQREAIVVLLAFAMLGAIACGDDSGGRTPSMIAPPPSSSDVSQTGVNTPPMIESIEFVPARPAPGRVVEAVAQASDADGDAVRVHYRWFGPRGNLLAEGPRLDTTGLEPGARVEVQARAEDGHDESPEVSRRLRLSEPSTEVALVAIEAEQGTHPGAVLRAFVESTKGRFGDFRTDLEWRVNGEVVGREDELDTTRFAPGDIVTLSARIESTQDRPSQAVTSKPVVLSQSSPPEILSEPVAGIEGGVFRYQLSARSAAPGAILRYELLEGPEGMTVEAQTGLVEWRPTDRQRGRFEIELAVRDQWGAGAAQSFAIEAAAPAAPPARAR